MTPNVVITIHLSVLSPKIQVFFRSTQNVLNYILPLRYKVGSMAPCILQVVAFPFRAIPILQIGAQKLGYPLHLINMRKSLGSLYDVVLDKQEGAQ